MRASPPSQPRQLRAAGPAASRALRAGFAGRLRRPLTRPALPRGADAWPGRRNSRCDRTKEHGFGLGFVCRFRTKLAVSGRRQIRWGCLLPADGTKREKRSIHLLPRPVIFSRYLHSGEGSRTVETGVTDQGSERQLPRPTCSKAGIPVPASPCPRWLSRQCPLRVESGCFGRACPATAAMGRKPKANDCPLVRKFGCIVSHASSGEGSPPRTRPGRIGRGAASSGHCRGRSGDGPRAALSSPGPGGSPSEGTFTGRVKVL